MSKPEHNLYRKGEVPKELKGRGVWEKFGKEMLFSPFSGTKEPSHFPEFDWKCNHCGKEWYKSHIKGKNEFHCPFCGKYSEMFHDD